MFHRNSHDSYHLLYLQFQNEGDWPTDVCTECLELGETMVHHLQEWTSNQKVFSEKYEKMIVKQQLKDEMEVTAEPSSDGEMCGIDSDNGLTDREDDMKEDSEALAEDEEEEAEDGSNDEKDASWKPKSGKKAEPVERPRRPRGRPVRPEFEQYMYQCPVCPKKYLNKYYHTNHIRQFHEEYYVANLANKPEPEENSFICTHCGMELETIQKLVKHERKHTPLDQRIKCRICAKPFLTLRQLKTHLIHIHKPYITLSCTLCDYLASKQSLIDRHKSIYHSAKRKLNTCPRCDTTVLDLQMHLKRCQVEEYHPCPKCSHIASNKFALTKHIRYNHNGVKNFQTCPICAKQIRGNVLFTVSSKRSEGAVLFY